MSPSPIVLHPQNWAALIWAMFRFNWGVFGKTPWAIHLRFLLARPNQFTWYNFQTFSNLQPHLDVVFLPLWKKLFFSFSGSFYESPTLAPLLPNYHRNCDFDQYIWTFYEWFAPIRHVDRFPALFTWWLFRFYFLTSFLLLLQPATRLGMTYCVCIFVMDRLCLR